MLIYPPSTDWAAAGVSTSTLENYDDKKREYAESLAWYTLAALTAWRIGVAPTEVRPCALGCSAPGSYLAAPVAGNVPGLPGMSIGTFAPYLSGGNWYNACGCSSSDCSCSRVDEVILPGPVGEIVSVKIGSETISPSRYRVDNGNRLVSTDPELQWPICQDMTANPGAEDTFAVTYYRGAAPNAMLNAAAGMLAAEFYKAATGAKCRLPKGVTEVTRRGVSFTIPTGQFVGGDTGLPEVNAVIAIYNPHGLKSAPRALSPETRRARRTTVR